MNHFIEKTERFVKKKLENIDSSHDYLHIARVRLLALQFAKSCASCRPDEPVEGNVSHPPRDSCTYFVDKDYNLIVEKSIQRFNQDPFELDLEMIEMAALLHDVGDFKYASVTPSDSNQCDILRSFLVDELQYPNANEILFIIDHLSYRDELAEPEYLKDRLAKVQSMKEFATLMSLAIVQDADRIDAIGAIGIARCFAYGAVKGHPFYDAATLKAPQLEMNYEMYQDQTLSNKGNPIHHFYEKLLKIKDKIKTKAAGPLAQERHEFMITFLRTFEEEAHLQHYPIDNLQD